MQAYLAGKAAPHTFSTTGTSHADKGSDMTSKLTSALRRHRRVGRRVLADQRGFTFDVGSLMVGALVAGFLAAAVWAALAKVIPWAQDQSAQSTISGVSTAQETYYAYSADYRNPSYATMNELRGSNDLGNTPFLNPDDGLDADGAATVSATVDADQWVLVVKSASGNYYWAHNFDSTPKRLGGNHADITAAADAAVSEVASEGYALSNPRRADTP